MSFAELAKILLDLLDGCRQLLLVEGHGAEAGRLDRVRFSAFELVNSLHERERFLEGLKLILNANAGPGRFDVVDLQLVHGFLETGVFELDAFQALGLVREVQLQRLDVGDGHGQLPAQILQTMTVAVEEALPEFDVASDRHELVFDTLGFQFDLGLLFGDLVDASAQSGQFRLERASHLRGSDT